MQPANNHEMWVTCPGCGCQFDYRLNDCCDTCGEQFLTHGSLCTGRGGFDAGGEIAGFGTLWQSEINTYCKSLLKEQYPNAIQYGDLKNIGKNAKRPLVISAGFPCQDISLCNTNNPQGIFGKKSSIFFEVVRIASLLRPQYLVMENSPMLLTRGMHTLLAALTKIGYMCEWECLRASDFGYPHKRERIYIIAYPMRIGRRMRVFRPLKTFELHQKWTPTETYLRVSGSRALAFADNSTIPEHDVISGYNQEIRSLGNAVMPVIAEYIFQCIRKDVFSL